MTAHPTADGAALPAQRHEAAAAASDGARRLDADGTRSLILIVHRQIDAAELEPVRQNGAEVSFAAAREDALAHGAVDATTIGTPSSSMAVVVVAATARRQTANVWPARAAPG
jgi:hypothetical protein